MPEDPKLHGLLKGQWREPQSWKLARLLDAVAEELGWERVVRGTSGDDHLEVKYRRVTR